MLTIPRFCLAFWACCPVLWAPIHGDALELGFPLDCDMGRDCVLQNYVDHDPGPGHLDHRCGFLSYNGHTGTDIRIRDYLAMASGVRVIAAANGVVKAVRDGMPDNLSRAVDVTGRECGNGVLLVHDDDWETQYCHLRRGSVAVKPGDKVELGRELGLVGLSGRTEFPHLEILVRHKGEIVDPFVGQTEGYACGQPAQGLWRGDNTGGLAYREVAVFGAGFAAAAPTLLGVEQGRYLVSKPSGDDDGMFYWARVIGLRPEHRLHLRLIDPRGRVLVDSHHDPIERSKAQWLAWSGLKRPEPGWVHGIYTGVVTIRRGGEVMYRASHRFELSSGQTEKKATQ